MEYKDKKSVLFVCLGNICRSPAAEAIFQAMVDKQGLSGKYLIDSAGTYGGHAGSLPDERMRGAACRRGYDLRHRSRQFREEDFERFDYILVMDDRNYEHVCRMAPDRESLRKISRMADYCRKFPVDHVPDPYYEGAEGFEYVIDILEDACSVLLDELENYA